jgi:hypothetical protein
LKTVTVDKLTFKEHLSVIEQVSLKNFLVNWVGSPAQRLEDFLQLEYTENVFAKLEKTTMETELLIPGDDHFRYITLTEDNQIVIGVLDSNKELKHKILSVGERLGI